MIKTTQKELKGLVNEGRAVDITYCDSIGRGKLLNREGRLDQIAYAAGVYGCNGQLYQGRATGNLYAITSRSTAIYLFS